MTGSHLILGGARSGKSRYAETLASQQQGNIVFIATAQAQDAEMAQRIAHHQRHRPAHWQLLEEPIHLAASLQHALEHHHANCIIIDCLSLWLSNLLGSAPLKPSKHTAPAAPQQLTHECTALLDCLPNIARHAHVLLVSNETGMGIVPTHPLGRLFRDEIGRLHQALAAQCDAVSLIVAGLPLPLKPR